MSGSSMNPKHPKTLHFFRIILAQTQKLALPRRFVSIYGNDLSNSVILKAPMGPEWKVELIKSDDEIWLANGWKDFADYFSLKYGNLLIFRYEGRSRFYVFMIFDQTTFEIEYPIDIGRGSKDGNHDVELQTPKVEEVETDDLVEIVDNVSRSRKTTEKTLLLPCFSPRKRTRTTPSSGMQGAGNVEFLMSRKYGSKIGSKEAGQGMSAARRLSTSSRANCFGSENPFFVVNVRQSYINGHDLHIPVAFARTYFTPKEADVVLRDRDGRTWPVHLKAYEKHHLAQFGHGWKAFAIDNDLQVGDSCAFEMLEGPEMSFRVTIFRNPEDSNDRHTDAHGSKTGHVQRERELNARSQFQCDYSSKDEVIRSFKTNKESHVPRRNVMTENRKFEQAMHTRAIRGISIKGTGRALERVSELRSDYPFFKVVITAGFLQQGYPTIPGRFCDEHMERLPEDVTLKFKGKSWPMRMITCLDRTGKFSGGWRAFAWGNKLKAGDVCVFEMIKKTDIVFKVSIFRDGFSLG